MKTPGRADLRGRVKCFEPAASGTGLDPTQVAYRGLTAEHDRLIARLREIAT